MTIPRAVHEDLGVKVGDVLAMEKEGDVWLVRRQPGDLVEFLRGLGTRLRPPAPEFLGEIDADGRDANERSDAAYGIETGPPAHAQKAGRQGPIRHPEQSEGSPRPGRATG